MTDAAAPDHAADRPGSRQGGLADETGAFVRDTAYIEDRVTADGGDGWPVEPGRYRLVVARACPWANRAIIVRRLLGLEPVLSMAIAGPTHDERSWRFDLDPGGVDPVLGIPRLEDAFEARFPGYPKGITVPAIVDVPSGQVVTNDYPQMTLDLSTEWTEHHRPGAPDLYPEAQRAEIDEVADLVYRDVNNGVYAAGFSRSQDAYEAAYTRLFDRLDWLSGRLTGNGSWWATPSPRPTSAFSPPWPASTPSTTATSSATGPSSRRCRCSGPMPETCSRLPASVTPPTSTKSRSTTTWSTPR
jgi:putative glutathione S-transferase